MSRWLLLLALLFMFTGCRTIPTGFDPANAGQTLDEAAVGCLNWAWFEKDHVNEIGTGLYETDTGYACGQLLVGDPVSVSFLARRLWEAILHTHTRGQDVMSKQDMLNARDDPRLRPSYVRFRTGTVKVYECQKADNGQVTCAGRRVG